MFQQDGGRVVAFEAYTTGDRDFSAQLTKMGRTKPDIIFLPSYYNDVPLQVKQAHRLGITAPFLGSDAWSSEELVKMCGSDCEGYYFCNHYAPDITTPAATRFIKAYKARYGTTPDDVAALTYDSFGLLWQALKNAGRVDRQAVRDGMSRISDYKGVTGSMRFTKGSGDPIKSAVILQIRDGRFRYFTSSRP